MHNETTSTRRPWIEIWEDFVVAAEKDYRNSVAWYETELGGHAEGPEDVRVARADVLAAHAALQLAREERARARAWAANVASEERLYGDEVQGTTARQRAG